MRAGARILFPFSPFLFDDKTSKQNTIFSIEFIQNKIRYYYSVELNNLAIINEALYYYNPKKAIVFKKKTDGSTELFSLADFDSSVVRNTTSIYNAYKSGKLGAKPNLVDYYLDFENE